MTTARLEVTRAHGSRSTAAAGGNGAAPRADRAEIGRTLGLLYEPGDVVELRAPGSRQGTLSGYFDDMAALAAAGAELSGTVSAVYVTLNPVKRALLARTVNRVKPYAKITTADADILERRWLLFDFDPQRPAGISSTDAEHAAALAAARACRQWLIEQGIPSASLALADSGNGGHVLARIDLPNTPESTTLVRRCLEATAPACNTAEVVLDPTVYNAARIVKLYGTVAAKGDTTEERPHRSTRMLEPLP
jgi:hypothetical protein